MPLREDLIKKFDKHFFYFEFNENIINNLKDFLATKNFIENYINIKSKKK